MSKVLLLFFFSQCCFLVLTKIPINYWQQLINNLLKHYFKRNNKSKQKFLFLFCDSNLATSHWGVPSLVQALLCLWIFPSFLLPPSFHSSFYSEHYHMNNIIIDFDIPSWKTLHSGLVIQRNSAHIITQRWKV